LFLVLIIYKTKLGQNIVFDFEKMPGESGFKYGWLLDMGRFNDYS
jgi:hypothetical protein